MKNVGVRGVKSQPESEERSTAPPRRDDGASRRKTNRLSLCYVTLLTALRLRLIGAEKFFFRNLFRAVWLISLQRV